MAPSKRKGSIRDLILSGDQSADVEECTRPSRPERVPGPEQSRPTARRAISWSTTHATASSTAGSSSSIVPTQRTARGPSKGWVDWNKGQLRRLQCNEFYEVIGENAQKYHSQLDKMIGSRILPFTYKDFNGVPEDRKKAFWQEIKSNILDVLDGYKSKFMIHIRELWKKKQSKLKAKYFDPEATIEANMASKPPELDPESWRFLVVYWLTPEAKMEAERNTANIKRFKSGPRLGRKSIVEVREERRGKDEPTDKLSMWLWSRTKDKGEQGCNNEETTKILHLIQNKLQEISEEQRQDVEAREKIFHYVLGPDAHGRRKGEGQASGTMSQQHDRLTVEEIHNRQMQAMVEQLEAQKAENESLKAKVASHDEKIASQDEKISSQGEKLSRLEEMMSQILACDSQCTPASDTPVGLHMSSHDSAQSPDIPSPDNNNNR